MDSDIVGDCKAKKVCRSSSYSRLSLIALFNKVFMISNIGTNDRHMRITVDSAVYKRKLALSDTLKYVFETFLKKSMPITSSKVIATSDMVKIEI